MSKLSDRRVQYARHFANLFSELETREMTWIVEAARSATVAEIEALELVLARLRAGFAPLKPAAIMDWAPEDHEAGLEDRHKSAHKRLIAIDALLRVLEASSAHEFVRTLAEVFKGRI